MWKASCPEPSLRAKPQVVSSLRPCENFLYGFKAAPRGRSRRRHGAQAVALAGAPLRPGQRRSAGATSGRSWSRLQLGKLQGHGRFDKGTLAAALIGLMRAGQKPARSADKRTGRRPLSNPPLRPPGADETSPVPPLTSSAPGLREHVSTPFTIKSRPLTGHYRHSK